MLRDLVKGLLKQVGLALLGGLIGSVLTGAYFVGAYGAKIAELEKKAEKSECVRVKARELWVHAMPKARGKFECEQ